MSVCGTAKASVSRTVSKRKTVKRGLDCAGSSGLLTIMLFDYLIFDKPPVLDEAFDHFCSVFCFLVAVEKTVTFAAFFLLPTPVPVVWR